MSKKTTSKATKTTKQKNMEDHVDTAKSPVPIKGKRFPLSNALLAYRKLYHSTYILNEHPIRTTTGDTKQILIRRANLQLQQISDAFNILLEKAKSDNPPKTALVPDFIANDYMSILKYKPAIDLDLKPLVHVSF